MRDDLLDAQAAIDWGELEIPQLAQKFVGWRYRNIGITYDDSSPDKTIALFRQGGPLPDIFNAGVGSIINSFRTALDLLAAVLATRNNKPVNEKIKFPNFPSHLEFSDPKNGIESIRWLSQSEIDKFKCFQQYNGAIDLLWALHKLDIIRKHKRLLGVSVEPTQLIMVGEGGSPKILYSNSQPLRDKTPLFELPIKAMSLDIDFNFQILFEEESLPRIHRQPIFQLLGQFSALTKEIVDLFDA